MYEIIIIFLNNIIKFRKVMKNVGFINSFRILREKYGNMLIVIKPHPRENIELIQNILFYPPRGQFLLE